MADAYRFQQQNAGGYYYPPVSQPQHPRHHVIRNSTPPNNTRSPFAIDTPSPSRSPDSHSPGHNPYSMYNANQQGQHGRANGASRGMQQHMGMYNYQQPSSHQQQHPQQHSSIQQDTNSHATNGGTLNHHNNYSSTVLTSTTPNFVPSALQNGQSLGVRGGLTEQNSPHWNEVLKLHKDTKTAHSQYTAGQSHYYARSRSAENRQAVYPTTGATPAGDSDNPTRISTTEDPALKRQEWSTIDLSGQGFRALTESFFRYSFLTEVYLNSNNLTSLPEWFGDLRHLTLLDVSNNKLRSLPAELGMCVFLKSLLAFDNQIEQIPQELGSLFQLDVLGVIGNPALETNITEEIKQHGTKALIKRLLENSPVPLPPRARNTVVLHDSPSSDHFKVFSYNILCDNATRRQYDYTPSKALDWNFRRNTILQEIESSAADIVCLQEVDVDSFNEYFSVKLAYTGYKGVFWPKARAKTMSQQDAKVVDGCATFYKGEKYMLLDKHLIDFQSIAINRPDMKGQQDVFNRVMPRDQMAVLTFFENRATGSRLIVANGHLFWDPQYADVKLVQTAILLDQINKQAEKYARWPALALKSKKQIKIKDEVEEFEEPLPEPAPSMEYSSFTQIPLLMCVDLNSTEDSSVYDLLSKGRVSAEHKDLAGYSYGNLTRDGIDHPFTLRSAYSHLNNGNDALTFTNYTPTFKGVIDHIFFSTNALEVVSLLGGVDNEYMKRVPGFPNYHFPSDHLSLAAEFSVKARKDKKSIPEPDFGTSSRRDRRD